MSQRLSQGRGRAGIHPLRAAPGADQGELPPPAGQVIPAFGMLRDGERTGRLIHLEHIAGRTAVPAPWPDWVPAEVTEALGRRGVRAPWSHQVTAADHARHGRNVIISTGTASGKSLGYLLPALTGILEGGTALYIAPTKALAADQLAAVRALGLPGVRAAALDGDTSAGERAWARSHADYLLTNPDMLHHVLLPQHRRWPGFFSRLRYVIVDECHGYRGVFGSHVGHVLRRLRRVAGHHARDTHPVFILASATAGQPGETARRLTGLAAEEVTVDGSPHGPVSFALWEPPLTPARGEAGAPVRRTATAEAAELLAGLVREDVATLAFVRSRRGAEAVALHAKRLLTEQGAGDRAGRVAAYRSGYLAEDRRRVEAALRGRRLTGLATTTALELGVNITGLDAVLIAGWPGTRASLWQQAGRAGRRGTGAVAVLIARDDPLDTYLVHHPEILRDPVEATVLDPGNPYVLAPHLCAAAAELPLTEADLALFGPGAAAVAEDLRRRSLLRRRPSGWYWTRRAHAARMTSLRGTGAEPVKIVEETTGRLVGTVDEPSAHVLAHDGATYLHQGDTYLVSRLDLADGVALVGLGDPGYVTSARQVTDIEIIGRQRQMQWGDAQVCFGDVEVTTAGHLVRPAPGRQWPPTGRDTAGPAAADAMYPRDVVDRLRCAGRAADRGRGGSARCRARGRACLHRPAPALRDLRPVGHRRRLHRRAPRDRPPDGVRLRRARGRRRLRRTRLRGRRRLAHGHPAGDRIVQVRGRLPVLHPIAEVRKRQHAAVQDRGPGPAGHAAHRPGSRPGWQKGGGPRRGGERGPPHGPALGGRSRTGFKQSLSRIGCADTLQDKRRTFRANQH